MPKLTLLPDVSFDGREIGGARLRGLLALLATDLRAGASTGRLVDGLWPDRQPENPTKALQVLVFRARAQLGAELIASTPGGYRLALAEEQVDAAAVLLRAAACARHAGAGDHAAALAEAEAGLALWPGKAGDEPVLDDPVATLRAERAGAYRSLLRERALALSRLGRHGEAVEPLAELARERPRDEEILLELLRSEAATAGPPAALDRYDAYRRELRDDLGTDPGPALQALYRELLSGRPEAVRHGVLEDPNPLLGRDADIDAVESLLRTSRVASIVGTGGLGKTRLANAVSRRAEYPVVCVVGLAAVGADEDVLAEVASALGIGESRRAPDLITGVAGALGPGPALLVLDNCEQVIRGAAELVGALVARTRELRVLTTSRAPLGLTSESVYPLPELSLPTMVELFGQRARAARPGVELPADPVEEICRHLDGLPLAVELAAARVRVMSVAEIARRLDDRFGLLRGGARDAPERHHTLRAVVDWSWNLLAPDGRAAMRALAVFPGGFTAAAAERLLAGDALPVLEHLVDQSLLKAVDTPSGLRFLMLETVREFAAADREAAGEGAVVIDRFLDWARELGLAHHDALFGTDPFATLGLVRAEQDNLVQALRYALAREDAATVAAVSAVLGGLWTVESNYPRMAVMADETAGPLSHLRPGPELVEAARTAATLSTMYVFLLRGPQATRSLAVLRRLPPAPPDTVVRALAVVLAAIPEISGPDAGALARLRSSPEPLLAGVASGTASFLLEATGEQEGALAAAEAMLRAMGGNGNPWVRILAHSRVGELCLYLERPAEAAHHFGTALDVVDAMSLRPDLLQLRWAMALAQLQIGDIDEAERWFAQAAQGPDDQRYGFVLDAGVRAEIMLARGDVEAGLRQWRDAVARVHDIPPEPHRVEPPGLEVETLEAEAAAVVAHAQHARLDLVRDIAGGLPAKLDALLGCPAGRPPTYLVMAPVWGALLLALAMVDLDRGATRGAVRLIALAERFRFLRGFQPTMSGARAREMAENADRPAYEEALSSYAGLDRDALRDAALAALAERRS